MLANVDALIGQSIGGYRLERVIGRGGTGAVFFARNEDNSTDVAALKLLIPPPQLPDEAREDLRHRFLREVAALQRLAHPHILAIRGFGDDAATGLAYMVLPYIASTLADRLKAGPIALAQISVWLNQIASAVDYAHTQGIIHRDLKPENILLDAADQTYISDFGIIKLFDEVTTKQTITGQVLGTPLYMAPEQGAGDAVTDAADIYSLGMVVYHLVTGQVAFQGTAPMAIMLKQMHDAPPAPRALRPDLPEPAEAAILKALAKKPTDRFPTAQAFAASFAAGLEDRWEGVTPAPQPFAVDPYALLDPRERPGALPPLAPIDQSGPDGMPTSTPLMPVAAPSRRNPLLILVAVGAVLLVVTGSLVIFSLLRSSPKTTMSNTIASTSPLATYTPFVLPTTTPAVPTTSPVPTATAKPRATATPVPVVSLPPTAIPAVPTATPVPPTDTPIPHPYIVDFFLPSGDAPQKITKGPDGNLWFTEFQNRIGVISTSGSIHEYTIPTANSGAYFITADLGNYLWFTERNANKIGRVTTSGSIREFAIPTSNSGPTSITLGPDGNVWFLEGNADKIAEISSAGAISEYNIGSGSDLDGLTTGPDANLWFDDFFGARIGSYPLGGSATFYSMPTGGSGPLDITTGPDGNLWFVEYYADKIGRITTSGAVTEFPIPTSKAYPIGIVQGADGNLWFVESDSPHIGRITPSGAIREYPNPTGCVTSDITAGPDGNLWFADSCGAVGRLSP